MSNVTELRKHIAELNAKHDAHIVFEYAEGDAVPALRDALERPEELEELFSALVLEGGKRSPATLALLVYLFGNVEVPQ